MSVSTPVRAPASAGAGDDDVLGTDARGGAERSRRRRCACVCARRWRPGGASPADPRRGRRRRAPLPWVFASADAGDAARALGISGAPDVAARAQRPPLGRLLVPETRTAWRAGTCPPLPSGSAPPPTPSCPAPAVSGLTPPVPSRKPLILALIVNRILPMGRTSWPQAPPEAYYARGCFRAALNAHTAAGGAGTPSLPPADPREPGWPHPRRPVSDFRRRRRRRCRRVQRTMGGRRSRRSRSRRTWCAACGRAAAHWTMARAGAR